MFVKCTKEELPQVLQAINPNFPVKDFSDVGDECWFIENGVPVKVVFGDNAKSDNYQVNLVFGFKETKDGTTHAFLLKPEKNLNNFPSIQKEIANLLDNGDGNGFNWDFAGIGIPEETVAAIQHDAVREFQENVCMPDQSNALDLLYAMADVVRNDPRMPEKDLDMFNRLVYEARDILIDREGRK